MKAVDFVLLHRNSDDTSLRDIIITLLGALSDDDITLLANNLHYGRSDFQDRLCSCVSSILCEGYYTKNYKGLNVVYFVKSANEFQKSYGIKTNDILGEIFKRISKNLFKKSYQDKTLSKRSCRVENLHFSARQLSQPRLMYQIRERRCTADEFLFFLYWDMEVFKRYKNSGELKLISQRQEENHTKAIIDAWNLYKRTVIDLFPPQYNRFLPKGVITKGEVIAPNNPALTIEELLDEGQDMVNFITDFGLSVAK